MKYKYCDWCGFNIHPEEFRCSAYKKCKICNYEHVLPKNPEFMDCIFNRTLEGQNYLAKHKQEMQQVFCSFATREEKWQAIETRLKVISQFRKEQGERQISIGELIALESDLNQKHYYGSTLFEE